MFIQLIYNFALLIALSVLSGVVDQFVPRPKFYGKILQGLLFGGAALIGMLYPLKLAEGLIFDGRSIVISLATLFFGPVTGIISAIPAALYRIHIGGPGVYMGTGVIITSFLVGWLYFRLRKAKKISLLRYRHLLLFGFSVHIIMMALLAILPTGLRSETFRQMGLIILFAYPAITLIMGIILNDQEQNKKLLHELRESEKFLNTIFSSIGDSLISLDNDFNIIALNNAAEQILGLNISEAKGRKIDELLSLNNEGRPLNHLFRQDPDYSIVQPADIAISKKGIIRATGTVSRVRDEDNLPKGWVLSLRDISREKEYEKRLLALGESYKGLFNSILSAVYIQNEKGEFLDVNQAALKLYGYPYEKFIGNTPEFLSAPGLNNLDELALNIRRAYEGMSVQFEFWGKKANGQIFPKDVFLFPTNYQGQKAVVAIAHDISERKEAERILRQSEARYKNLFESSPMGMILEDLDGTIISVNSVFCKEYGYEPIELIGKNIRVLASPGNKELVRRNIEHIIRFGKLSSQIKATTKSGQEIDLELIETLVDLPDGRKGILSIGKNITSQVQAEKARHESEIKTKAIIHALPDNIFVLNDECVFVEFFAQSEESLLIKPEAFLNQPADRVLPPFLAAMTKEALSQVLSTGKPVEYDYELFINNRSQHFEARMVPLDQSHTITLVRNITEKKNSEKAIRQQNTFIATLLDSIPNPLFYMDKNSVYLGVNKAFTEFFGIKREEIIGNTMFQWDIQNVAAKNHADDMLIFEGRETTQLRERTITMKDGSERNVLVSKSAFHGPDGEVEGLIGLLIDITERKKNEKELLAAKQKAEESDQLKTSFLHNLNHEIRTPLNAILGFSDLLFEEVPNDQKREFVQIINSNAEQLLRIIDDVLIVSRMDAERMGIEEQRFGITQFLNDLKLTFANACADKRLSISLEIKDNEKAEILTDRAKLRQALSGLLDNAVKYTQTGGITLSYNIVDKDIRISVSDTGIGIPPKDLNHIFERFFRGEKPQQLAIRGNGLGLSIVDGLVKLLKGSIEVQSTPGMGSVFTIVLPGIVVENQSETKTETSNQPQSEIPPQFNFLIAEDEDDNFEYLRMLLAGHALVIDRARNGAEVIELLEQKTYDLVLMDIKMPVMDGLEATKIVRNKYPKLPIVVQTAYSQPDELRMIMEAGATDVLIKPINKEVFYQVIQRLLG